MKKGPCLCRTVIRGPVGSPCHPPPSFQTARAGGSEPVALQCRESQGQSPPALSELEAHADPAGPSRTTTASSSSSSSSAGSSSSSGSSGSSKQRQRQQQVAAAAATAAPAAVAAAAPAAAARSVTHLQGALLREFSIEHRLSSSFIELIVNSHNSVTAVSLPEKNLPANFARMHHHYYHLPGCQECDCVATRSLCSHHSAATRGLRSSARSRWRPASTRTPSRRWPSLIARRRWVRSSHPAGTWHAVLIDTPIMPTERLLTSHEQQVTNKPKKNILVNEKAMLQEAQDEVAQLKRALGGSAAGLFALNPELFSSRCTSAAWIAAFCPLNAVQ